MTFVQIKNGLFPDSFREFPQRRMWLGLLRAVHIVCFSVLLGGYVFVPNLEVLFVWWIGVLVSGLAMLAIDLYGSFVMLLEVRGLSIVGKILLCSLLPFLSQGQGLWVLILLVVFSSLVSHSTRRIRHRNLIPPAWRKRFGLENKS